MEVEVERGGGGVEVGVVDGLGVGGGVKTHDNQIQFCVQMDPRMASRAEEQRDEGCGKISGRLDGSHRYAGESGGVVTLVVV